MKTTVFLMITTAVVGWYSPVIAGGLAPDTSPRPLQRPEVTQCDRVPVYSQRNPEIVLYWNHQPGCAPTQPNSPRQRHFVPKPKPGVTPTPPRKENDHATPPETDTDTGGHEPETEPDDDKEHHDRGHGGKYGGHDRDRDRGHGHDRRDHAHGGKPGHTRGHGGSVAEGSDN